MATLIDTIMNGNVTLALALIPITDVGYINDQDVYALDTALMCCTFHGNSMNTVALALIATGKSRPEYCNTHGSTALIYACHRKCIDVALTLIASGKSRPGHYNKYGICALEYACRNHMIPVIRALIATNKLKQSQITRICLKYLIIACRDNLPELALAVLTARISAKHLRHNSATALKNAYNNNMHDVVYAIEHYASKPHQFNDPTYVFDITI